MSIVERRGRAPAFAACPVPAPAALRAPAAVSHASSSTVHRPLALAASRAAPRRTFMCTPPSAVRVSGLRAAWLGSADAGQLLRKLQRLQGRTSSLSEALRVVAEQETTEAKPAAAADEAGPSKAAAGDEEAPKGLLGGLVPAQGWDVPWEFNIIFAVLAQWFISYLACGALVLPLAVKQLGLDVSDPRGQSLFLLANYMTEMGLGFYVLNRYLEPFYPLEQRDLFRYTPSPQTIGAGVVGFLWAIPVVILASFVNQQVLHGGEVELQAITDVLLKAQDDPLSVAIFLFTVAFLAPVWEETMFRGFLLTSLTKYMPTWGAIGVSGVVFAGAHLSAQHMIPLTALGWVLGLVYTRTRSLATSITLHAMWNSITVAALLAGLGDL
eukprot:tig00021428_g21172.t1